MEKECLMGHWSGTFFREQFWSLDFLLKAFVWIDVNMLSRPFNSVFQSVFDHKWFDARMSAIGTKQSGVADDSSPSAKWINQISDLFRAIAVKREQRSKIFSNLS